MWSASGRIVSDAQLIPRPQESTHFGHAVFAVSLRAADDVARSIQDVAAYPGALLIARVAAAEIGVAQAMERAGGVLCDVLLTLQRDVVQDQVPAHMVPGVPVRQCEPDDASAVAEIAEDAFRNFVGHWHMDGNLPPRESELLYAKWAGDLVAKMDRDHPILVCDIKRR